MSGALSEGSKHVTARAYFAYYAHYEYYNAIFLKSYSKLASIDAIGN